MSSQDDAPFTANLDKAIPPYLLNEAGFFEKRKLIGFLRCYDCEGEVPLDQADSMICRKVHQTINKLSNRGWTDSEILMECKRIYGNDILYRHYTPPPPYLVNSI